MKKLIYLLLVIFLQASIILPQTELSKTDSVLQYDSQALLPIGVKSGGKYLWKSVRVENLQKMLNLDAVYPEMYYINNWRDAIIKAFQVARDSGRAIVFTKTYTISQLIDLPLNGKTITVQAVNGGGIYTTAATDTNDYYKPRGALHFSKGNVIMDGFNIRNAAPLNPATNYFNNLLFTQCDTVILRNVVSRYATYAGIQVVACNYLTADACVTEYNNYAGFLVRGTTSGYYDGGLSAFNGYIAPDNGYGFSLSGRFPYPYGSGSAIDNKDFKIINCTLKYNLRKAIDVHGNQRVIISNNTIYGYGNGGIYAVNEDGDANYEKWVRDVTIEHNIVDQDSVWWNGLGITEPIIPIQVGTYGFTDADKGGGVFNVIGNLVRNTAVNHARSSIFVFVNSSGARMDNINIMSNTLLNVKVSSVYNDDGAISLNAGSMDPTYVHIGDNYIYGDCENAIKVLAGVFCLVNNNVIDGDFSTKIYIDPGTLYKLSGNVFDKIPLLDINSNIYETKIGNLFITQDRVEEYATASDNGTVNVNFKNGSDSTNWFKNFIVWNGKGEQVAFFRGSDKLISFTHDVNILNDLYVTDHIQANSIKAGNYYSSDSTLGATTTVSGLIFKNGLFTGGAVSFDWANITNMPERISNYAGSSMQLRSNIIEENATAGTAELAFNYTGYLSATTYWRNANFYDGKHGLVASFAGETKAANLYGNLNLNGNDITADDFAFDDGSADAVTFNSATIGNIISNGTISSYSGTDLDFRPASGRNAAFNYGNTGGLYNYYNTSVNFSVSSSAGNIYSGGTINAVSGFLVNGAALATSHLVDFPTQSGNSGKILSTNGSSLSWINAASGTVTSVGLTVPTGLTVSGSPVTSSGTLAISLASGFTIPTQATLDAKATSANPSFSGVTTYSGDIDARAGSGGSVNFNYNAGGSSFYFWGGDATVDFSSTSGNLYAAGYINAVSGFKVNGTAYNLANWGSPSATSITSFSNVKKRTMTLSDGSTINVLTEN